MFATTRRLLMRPIIYSFISLFAGTAWINMIPRDVAQAVYENNFWLLVVAGVTVLFAGASAR